MVLNGVFRDVESASHLLREEPLQNQLGHLLLPSGEFVCSDDERGELYRPRILDNDRNLFVASFHGRTMERQGTSVSNVRDGGGAAALHLDGQSPHKGGHPVPIHGVEPGLSRCRRRHRPPRAIDRKRSWWPIESAWVEHRSMQERTPKTAGEHSRQ